MQFYQFTGVRIQPRYISEAPLFMATGRFNQKFLLYCQAPGLHISRYLIHLLLMCWTA
jgi:hypothetical protein